ncbi:MAG: molybdenum cofactor guanylyltransferase [Candidatus Thorarchaeota archaeon]|nr:molybdenum cofactor guanylyltransferase [Candidatus Thorarchaeota archaeon]
MSEKVLTVAILAGGTSGRFGSEKAMAKFRDRPLVTHMIDVAKHLSSDIIVVVSNGIQKETIGKVVTGENIVVDPEDSVRSALTGAVTAFEYATTEYVMLLPVDTPLASIPLLRSIAELGPGYGAVVPSWPSGYIEPLHATYLAEHAYGRGLEVIAKKKHRMRDLLDALHNVMHISTEVLKMFDPNLDTFVNINTEQELRKLEREHARIT